MIYIVDSDDAHASSLQNIIYDVCPSAETVLHCLMQDSTIENIITTINLLALQVRADDIVLLAWQVPFSDNLNMSVSRLATKCTVIVAAGNSKIDINDFSPSSAIGIKLAVCLNKSLNIATFSPEIPHDYINPIFFVVGTNYIYSNGSPAKISGSSVSAAVLAALFNNSKENILAVIQNYNNAASNT